MPTEIGAERHCCERQYTGATGTRLYRVITPWFDVLAGQHGVCQNGTYLLTVFSRRCVIYEAMLNA